MPDKYILPKLHNCLTFDILNTFKNLKTDGFLHLLSSFSKSSKQNLQFLLFLLTLLYLPCSVARLCDDSLILVINFLYNSGTGLVKYDCKQKVGTRYWYKLHLGEACQIASNSCLDISNNLCLITNICFLRTECCEYHKLFKSRRYNSLRTQHTRLFASHLILVFLCCVFCCMFMSCLFVLVFLVHNVVYVLGLFHLECSFGFLSPFLQ